MTNADDLILFARIVEAGSFAAASKHWDIPRATLSRRLARLESQLGVSLINRTSRQFSVTDFGMRVYHHCLAVMTEVEKVYSEASDIQQEPSGTLRISCPVVIAHTVVGKIAAKFAKEYDRVQVALEVTNRTVDPVGEGFDLVIRPTPSRLDDAEIIARKIAVGAFHLVATPSLVKSLSAPISPDSLQHLPVIGYGTNFGRQHWVLKNASGHQMDFPVTPVYVSDNLFAIKDAALIGMGIAALPDDICHTELAANTLVRILPDWAPPPMEFFALYPSRRGLAAAGRKFIEFMQDSMSISLAE